MNVTCVPLLARLRILRITSLCDWGQYHFRFMAQRSMMSPTRKRCRQRIEEMNFNNASTWQAFVPRCTSEIQTVLYCSFSVIVVSPSLTPSVFLSPDSTDSIGDAC